MFGGGGKYTGLFSSICFLGGISGVLFIGGKTDFTVNLVCFGLAFVGNFTLVQSGNRMLLNALAVSSAILAWLSFPSLSDDIYRFYWDGYSIVQGINPFDFKPTQHPIREDAPFAGLFPLLNSPDYYSIYPPLNQLLFAAGAVFQPSVYGFKWVYGIFFLIPYLIMLRGWDKWVGQPQVKYLVLLNPLLLVEGVGNLHAELLVIFCIWALYGCYLKGRNQGVLHLFSVSVALKLIPVMGIFLFLQRKNWKHWKLVWVAMVWAFLGVLFFYPWTRLDHFGSSFQLYFKNFEFVPFLYLPLRDLIQYFLGYNPIQTLGPVLGIISGMCILYISLGKGKGFPWLKLIGVLAAFYAFTTTFHPWYGMYFILPLAMLEKRVALFGLGALVLSYHFYVESAIHYGWWAVQWTVVLACFAYDFWPKKATSLA